MIMKNYKKDRYGVIFAVLCIILCVLGLFDGSPNTAYAADTATYSDVLADLQKDESFNAADYPAVENDYSLHVIQIAESSDGELLVYVYQPSRITTALTATELNMALSDSVDTTALFGLTLLNSNGVFCKYRVDGVTVSSDPVRHYNVTSIYRAWDNLIDKSSGTDNTIDYVSYSVGQLWTAVNVENEVRYYCTVTNVVTVMDKYLGSLRYYNGWKFSFSRDACDSHFVAFSTDYDIDYLYDADVVYSVETVFANQFMNDKTDKTVCLSDTDTASNAADGWFATKHTWNRIERVSDFIKNEDLTDECKNSLRDMQWILRFTETKCTMTPQKVVVGYSYVHEVSILRLHFKSNGQTFNLGAVDNKQSEDHIPDNIQDKFSGIFSWLKQNWQWIVIGVIGVIALIILMPLMPFILSALVAVFKAIGIGLVWLFKGLIYVISLPVRGIAALVRKIKGVKS